MAYINGKNWIIKKNQRRLGKHIKTVPSSVMDDLKAYPWPGNVRELEKAHSISKKIEEDIMNDITHVDHVLIHYEPVQKNTISFALCLNFLVSNFLP